MKVAVASVAICALVVPASAQTRSRTTPIKARSAQAQAKPVAESGACLTMMSDYEEASKKLALSKASDTVDNSAARSTMREAQNGNIINQARMTMDLMKANGCKLPTFIPSADRYGSASLSCAAGLQKNRTQEAIDRLSGRMTFHDAPAECDTSNWKPDGA